MKQSVCTAALCLILVNPALGQAPTAQGADPAAQDLGRGWAAFGQGKLDEAAAAAERVAAGSTGLSHDGVGLLIHVEASRDRVGPALAAYARWLSRSGREDRYLLYPIGERLLASLSRSKDAALRTAAQARLARSGLAELPAGAESDPASILARAEAGDKSAQQQVGQMVDASGDMVRLGMVRALAAGGSASVPQLSKLLANRAPDVRAAVVEALGNIGGPDAVRALESVRADRDPYVRLRVAVALAPTGDQDALTAVNAALASPVGDIRVVAAEAFQASPTEASRAALRSALSDPNPLTQARAAALLGESDDATRTLAGLVESENPTVRGEAARQVEERLSDDLPLVRSLLASRDPWVQLYGAGALLHPPSR